MELLLVRHGESEGNRRGHLQGQMDLPLTELGREQAQRLAAWLQTQRDAWDRLYASPLSRARETAEIVGLALGLTPELIPNLAEIRVGCLEGLYPEVVASQYPEFHARPLEASWDFSAYGGESYEEIMARAVAIRDLLVERHRDPAGRVVVVAHGGILRSLLKLLICVPEIPRVFNLHMGNCAQIKLRLGMKRGTYLGEIRAHLPVEVLPELPVSG